MSSPVTITGNTQNILGSSDVAVLTVELCNLNNGIPSLPGQAILTNISQNVTCSGGTFSFSVYGNDVIYVGGVTNNTFYSVKFLSSSGQTIATLAYQFTGNSTIDLSQLAPLNNTPPTFIGPVPSTAVLTNPTGAQTISTYGLTVPSLTTSGTVAMSSGQVLKWSTDTGLSRDSAGVLDIGNGTAGNKSGTVQATQANILGNLFLGSSQQLQFEFNPGQSVSGVSTTLLGIADNGVGWKLALDTTGNLGIAAAIAGQTLFLTAATPTVGAGQVGFGTTTAATATGGAATLPANPVGFLEINIAGTVYKIPYYAS